MIDLFIFFSIFYFLLYRRALKKYGDDPSKSIWIKLLRRYEGTWFDSLFEERQKNQVPIVKSIFAASILQLTCFSILQYHIYDIWEEQFDYKYVKDEDRSLYVATGLFCMTCFPVVYPYLLYKHDLQKNNPEGMFVYKYEQIKKSCVESGFKHRDCLSLFKMVNNTEKPEQLDKLSKVLLDSFESKYLFCQVAGRTSDYFFERGMWSKFDYFGEKACLYTEDKSCDFGCESYKDRKSWGKKEIVEHYEWVKELREAQGTKLVDYTWNSYPIPRDFNFKIEEIDEYLQNEM